MSLYLHINFPKNLISAVMVRQEKIPCICRVGREFEVIISEPLPEALGVVQGWDRDLLEERAMAGGGGQFTHYENGTITLEEVQPNIYKIVDLALFYARFGWCPILENGKYSPPGNFWDDEEEDTIGR